MCSRSFLSVLCLLVGVSTVAPRAAQAQTTGLFLDSKPGDLVGGGTSGTYTDGSFGALAFGSTSARSVTIITMTAPASAFVVELIFEAPQSVITPLPIGVYEAARRSLTPFNGLDVTAFGRRCVTSTGRFEVLEAVYDSDGEVVRFAADFEQHCNGNVPGLFGAIRFNSTKASMVPFGGAYPRFGVTVAPPLHGTVTGDGLTCGTGGSQCVADHQFAAHVSVHATPDAGYIFAGWGQDCAGGPHADLYIHMPLTCSASFVPLVPVQPRTLAVLMARQAADNHVIGSVLSPANSHWGLFSFDAGLELNINPGGLVPGWDTFNIQPPTGQSFQAGVQYPTTPFPDATHAGLLADGLSLGWYSCPGAGTGMMTVREWEATPGALPTRFSIDFELCVGQLKGTIQYAGTYEYSQLVVNPREQHFTAVADDRGIVSHSADQIFQITQSGPAPVAWLFMSDEPWLTALPATPTTAVTATARILNYRSSVFGLGRRIGQLQPFVGGLINIPDPLIVTLDVTSPDTTSRPFGVFRSATGAWLMPNQGALPFGLPGDIPLSGDFDGDGAQDIAIYRPSTGQWFAQGQPVRQWGLPGDMPVPADYNGDGITDIAVFRQSGPFGQWFIFGEANPRRFGFRGVVPVPGDYDGDGVADPAYFTPSTGSWSILQSSPSQTVATSVGQAGDIPVVADFDADRKIDCAVFRPSTGVWYISLSAGGNYSRQFGLPGDIPVPLDVTGDGRAELRVWRPSTGMWFSFNRSTSQSSTLQYGLAGDVPIMALPVLAGSRSDDADGDRRADVTIFRPSTGEWFTRQSATGYGTFTIQPWGLEGDIPVPGDYDGDRRANPAVYRPATGEWFVRRFDGTMLRRAWGLADDVPVPADYDGDGRTDMAVYRPSSGEWFILTSASDYATYWILVWGMPGDRPLTGDVDGDGRADVTVYRPSTGDWFVAASAGGYLVRQWGSPGAVPVARDFDGDGRADLAVYWPSTGEWFVLDAASGAQILTRQWGLDGDMPAADDYDGDGAADLAVYRPATREWFVLPSSRAPSFVLQWGLAGDVPVTRR
jgi:hypothetical protein